MSSDTSCSTEMLEGVITDALPTLCGANIYLIYILLPIATGKFNYQKSLHFFYLLANICFCAFWSLLLASRLTPISWLNYCYVPAVFYLMGWRFFDIVLMIRAYYISGKNILLRNILIILIVAETIKDIVIYSNVSCRYPNENILIAGIWIVWPKINYVGRISSLIYHLAVFSAIYSSVNRKVNELGTMRTISILKRMMKTSGWRLITIIAAEIILNVLILTVRTKNHALIMFQDNTDMIIASLYYIELFGYLSSRSGDQGQKNPRDQTFTKTKRNVSTSFMGNKNTAMGGDTDGPAGQTSTL